MYNATCDIILGKLLFSNKINIYWFSEIQETTNSVTLNISVFK